MVLTTTNWFLWGDQTEPYAEGTEEEVKQAYFENQADVPASEVLYIQSPDGTEYEYDGKKWVFAG